MTGPLRGSNGVAFGPDGRLYVCEFLAGRISAVDPATGDVETIVAPGGLVQSPDDLAFDSNGVMYITDLVPGRVWRRGPDGTLTLVTDQVRLPNGITCLGERLFVNEMIPGGRLLELRADGPAELTGGLAMGNAMQIGPDGHLYYPHMLTGEVHRISPDGGAPELVAADVHEPVAVRFDLAGTLLVVSRGAEGIVTRIDGDRRTLISSGITGLDNAAVDSDNRMYVSSYAGGGIAELHPDGRTRDIVPRGYAGPYGITIDLAGTVHVADHYRLGDELIRFAHDVAADGNLLHVTSQYGQVQTYDRGTRRTRMRATGLDRPLGIAVRPDGTLLVAESGAGRILTIGPDDSIGLLAEGLGRPAGIAGDYFSDEEHGTVHRLTDTGPELVADGLDTPQGLAVHNDRMFIVEAGKRRLLSVDLRTGDTRTERDLDLPARREVALTAHGMPGVPQPYAGIAVAPDGTLHVAADGHVLELS
ncbi:NHL repeat-containing protein [Actinoplanes sp. RD1]|uniref:hypothetical protein n=1 Tax=Actinoplanes sp. RD1 TaxID=3064538 RepID=UPI0027426C5E|nr:hypothetical protein [Actinoplanes sp. RD1]